jgi:hypothetical protein
MSGRYFSFETYLESVHNQKQKKPKTWKSQIFHILIRIVEKIILTYKKDKEYDIITIIILQNCIILFLGDSQIKS